VIVFDVGESGFCSQLDQQAGACMHTHAVPGDVVDVEMLLWEAPTAQPLPEWPPRWPASVPASHASVAVALVTYDASEPASLDRAKEWARDARIQLTAREADGFALLTLVLAGVAPPTSTPSADAASTDEDAPLAVSPSDGRAAAEEVRARGVCLCVPPSASPQPARHGRLTFVPCARCVCRRPLPTPTTYSSTRHAPLLRACTT
jgi:hypothetical protein